MHTHGGLDELREPVAELEGSLGAGKVPARDDDADDPRLSSALDDLDPVVVEGGMLEMAMGVDEARHTRGRGTPGQVATPGELALRIGSSAGGSSSDPPSSGSSVRGKRGSAWPVRQPSAMVPQLSSASRPGPPAPRPS